MTIKIRVGIGRNAKAKAKTRTETVIQLKFSADIQGAGNVGAYKLFLGKTKKHVTTYKTPLRLASAIYASSELTVTLVPLRKLKLSQMKQLQVTGALLTDQYGRALDGNDDGQPGGNFSADFKNRGIAFAQVSQIRVRALSAAAVDAALATEAVHSATESNVLALPHHGFLNESRNRFSYPRSTPGPSGGRKIRPR